MTYTVRKDTALNTLGPLLNNKPPHITKEHTNRTGRSVTDSRKQAQRIPNTPPPTSLLHGTLLVPDRMHWVSPLQREEQEQATFMHKSHDIQCKTLHLSIAVLTSTKMISFCPREWPSLAMTPRYLPALRRKLPNIIDWDSW